MKEKETKYNKTTNFLLPLLGYPKKNLEPYLVNAYLYHEEVEVYRSYHIFVLIRYYGDREFTNLEGFLESLPTFVASYELRGSEYVMYIFRIPDEFKLDYDKFLEGRYSELSEEAKYLIRKSSKPGSAMPKVLIKHPSVRQYWEEKIGTLISEDQEVWPVPNMEEEVFNLKMLEELE